MTAFGVPEASNLYRAVFPDRVLLYLHKMFFVKIIKVITRLLRVRTGKKIYSCYNLDIILFILLIYLIIII